MPGSNFVPSDDLNASLYPMPDGLSVMPAGLLDLRSDSEIDQDLTRYKPVEGKGEKNIWFFWDKGYGSMHGYTKRNVRTWHRRLSKQGWTIRVVDLEAGSPSSLHNYLDTNDPSLFPRAFIDGKLDGESSRQVTSDLVRLPLLLKYGGIYADVALLQIGDLDRLWNETLGNPSSPFEVLSYGDEDRATRMLTSYFLASRSGNALFWRAHRLLLALWTENGGRRNTEGIHASPRMAGVPLVGEKLGLDRTLRKDLSDYIFHGQALTMVMGLVDRTDGWNGPEYVARHVYAIDLKVGSSLYNEVTERNGARQFDLFSLTLPKAGMAENMDQREARQIVEWTLQQSFGFKLAQGGAVVKVTGETLGTLWRDHEGSDAVPGTYAHWLRHAALYWKQESVPPRIEYTVATPYKTGGLLDPLDASWSRKTRAVKMLNSCIREIVAAVFCIPGRHHNSESS